MHKPLLRDYLRGELGFDRYELREEVEQGRVGAVEDHRRQRRPQREGVEQAGGEAECAGFHRVLHDFDHPGDRGGCGVGIDADSSAVAGGSMAVSVTSWRI